MNEGSRDVGPRERVVGAALILHALVVFALCARTVALVAEGEGPVVVVSGASPHAGAQTIDLRALAIDPARERPLSRAPDAFDVTNSVRAPLDAKVDDGVRTVHAPRSVARIACGFDEDAEIALDLSTLTPASVRIRANPAMRDAQGTPTPPIHALRPRPSSFVDTPALVVVDGAIEREVLRADPGRIVDTRGRLLPIERTEIDVDLPPVLVVSDGGARTARLRAPSGAAIFIDVLVVEPRDLVTLRAGAAIDARSLALFSVTGAGAQERVSLPLPSLAALVDGDVVLVVAKGSPYPRSRGISAPAVIARDRAAGIAHVLALVDSLVPDDALLVFARAHPDAVDDEVLRALLSRALFEVEGLPAAGPPPTAQRAAAAEVRAARVKDARALFRIAGVSFVLVVVIVALVLVRTRRRTLEQAIEDDEPSAPDRAGVKAALAVVVVAAIVFTLDVVARLSW